MVLVLDVPAEVEPVIGSDGVAGDAVVGPLLITVVAGDSVGRGVALFGTNVVSGVVAAVGDFVGFGLYGSSGISGNPQKSQ